MKHILLLLLCWSAFGVRAQELLQTTVLDSFSVSFPYGSSVIRQKQQLLKRLKKIPKPEQGLIVLHGYTDSVGSIAYNELLADKRIQSVLQCVETSSLKSLKIETVNRNEQRFGPVTHDSLFRRVEIVVYKHTPQITFDKPINLHINFEPGTDVILPNSTATLNKLLTILQFDPSLNVKLNGHVCCENDPVLSEKRAARVREYLVLKGIKADRMSCQGFSNTLPLVEEITEEDRAMNRRVEVVFLKNKNE